jgi:predicted Zn-dependent protease
MLGRLALAVLCLVVAAWLALGLLDARLEQEGIELTRSPAVLTDAATAREADETLADAELLNPDTAPLLTRAGLALRRGEVERGVRLLRDVVEREPENLPAWRLLALAARATGDQRLEQHALERARELTTPRRSP